MAALEVEHVHTGYGDIRVVRDVSLTAEAGSISVLLGRNGVGKTTTLLAVAGLLPASSGHVSLHGRDITRARAEARVRAGLGFVQEGKRVFRDRTVDENLLLGAFTVRAGRKAWRRSIEEAYERFPLLREKRSEVAGRLSGGQQQMLAIAQALLAQPTVLMLDEPSAGLAPQVVDAVFDTLRTLREDGLAVLLVEQAIDQAIRISDHVYVMDGGRITGSWRTSELDAETIRSEIVGSSDSSAFRQKT
jgi:branched-chain amino acid transport system ATP-binding protein